MITLYELDANFGNMRAILCVVCYCTASISAFRPPAAVPQLRPMAPLRSAAARASVDGGPLEVTQISAQKAGELGVVGWNMVAIGEAAYEGSTVGKIDPSSAKTLGERLPGQALRYVLDGSGTVSAGGEVYDVSPSTLVEVRGAQDEDVVWTLGDGCDTALVVGGPEFYTPARVAARAAAPYVLGAMAALAVVGIVTGALAD